MQGIYMDINITAKEVNRNTDKNVHVCVRSSLHNSVRTVQR